MDKKAFTLAEVLTTLTIVGVIAAMTLPVLNANVTKQKNIAMLKRLYSSFSVNVQTILGQESCSSISCMRKYGMAGGANPTLHNGVFANKSVFNVERSCPKCVEDTAVLPCPMNPAFTVEEGVNIANYSTYILANGAEMLLYDFNGNCTTASNMYVKYRYDVGGGIGNYPVDVCGIVVFDINAGNGPNYPGKDRFAYYIVDTPIEGSYLIPMGYTNADDTNNKSSYNKKGDISSSVRNSGDNCEADPARNGYNNTAKVMLNNWKMD